MSWGIKFSKEADKFLSSHKDVKEKVLEIVQKSIKKLQGEDINIDIKKLKGKWSGFHRSRMGRVRVIMEFDFDGLLVFVEKIDYRGDVYK